MLVGDPEVVVNEKKIGTRQPDDEKGPGVRQQQ